jgi:hypothetical protein
LSSNIGGLQQEHRITRCRCPLDREEEFQPGRDLVIDGLRKRSPDRAPQAIAQDILVGGKAVLGETVALAHVPTGIATIQNDQRGADMRPPNWWSRPLISGGAIGR